MARRRHDVAKAKAKPYPPSLLELMASKTAILLKARTFADLGMPETAQPIWATAASCEERIAPLLDLLGRGLEAAASRAPTSTFLVTSSPMPSRERFLIFVGPKSSTRGETKLQKVSEAGG